MAVSKSDKIFAIGMTAALLVGFVVVIFRVVAFWNLVPGSLDPAGWLPMILGIGGMLILAAIIIGGYFRGRRQEISDAEDEERAGRKR